MDFLNASFRLGRLFGINVRVHILFLIWIAFRLFGAKEDWGFEAAFLGMLFGIVLIHEFGHCFGARAVGGYAENILMWPLGGLAFAQAPMTPWAQFVTVAAGPLVNVVFCLVTGAILAATAGTLSIFSLNPFNSVGVPHGAPEWFWYLAIFYYVNYWLLALNLLPIYPLDGGQLFQCVLWPFLGLQRAMTLACQVGLAGCIGLGVWGLSGSGGRMLIFIALFGGFTCWQRLKMLRYGMVVDERVKYAPYREYNPRRRGLFARIFNLRRRPRVSRSDRDADTADRQPQADEKAKQREAELDRILKKVHERGLHSLNYVERQTLERATRERQRRGGELQGKR